MVKESFITRYSQNTLYYQKFNVSGRSEMASHQYQQNIMAAQSQGSSLKNYYSGSGTPQTYTFIIPLYKNIPSNAIARPNPSQANSITYEDGIIQHISSVLKVRNGQGTGALTIGKLNNNEDVSEYVDGKVLKYIKDKKLYEL